MARYLVTGAAGFIGSRTAELLRESGHEVVGFDSFSDAYDVRLKSWRATRLESDGLRIVRADVCDAAAVEATLTQHGPFDAVVNLAARAGVRYSVENPWIYLDVNAKGTLTLLEACRRHGIGKFVLASTSSLYGRHNAMPYREDADTERPLSPYAASKKAAEALCHSYHHLHGLDVTVLRYFTVYGPAGRPDMSLFRFVQWVSEARPVILFGDGRQRRDFTYVDDIARGTVAALKRVGYEIVNLGSDRPHELLDALHLIERLVGKQAQVELRPAHPADVPATWADVGKARRLLGWQPTTSLEAGVEALVRWYQDNREWASEVRTDE